MVVMLDPGRRVEGYSVLVDLVIYLVRMQRITGIRSSRIMPRVVDVALRRMEEQGYTTEELTRLMLQLMGYLQVETYMRWTNR